MVTLSERLTKIYELIIYKQINTLPTIVFFIIFKILVQNRPSLKWFNCAVNKYHKAAANQTAQWEWHCSCPVWTLSPASTNTAPPHWGSQLDGWLTLLPSNQTAVYVHIPFLASLHLLYCRMEHEINQIIMLLMEVAIHCGSLKESSD